MWLPPVVLLPPALVAGPGRLLAERGTEPVVLPPPGVGLMAEWEAVEDIVAGNYGNRGDQFGTR